MLSIKKLTKKFGLQKAVDGVSLEVKPGEIFALIGPNGSGKTTIIKLVAGLLRPTSGKITVGGTDVSTEPERAKSQLGYIPDEPTVWPVMTGGEFLRFVGTLFGLPRAIREKRVSELLPLFNLGESSVQYFEDYSRGTKQKFSILAALLHQPKLLLIDEPIVGLDPLSAEIAQNTFSEFASAGGSVLLVTHSLEVAQNIAHRIGVLKSGRLTAEGSLLQLRELAKVKKNSTLAEVYLALS